MVRKQVDIGPQQENLLRELSQTTGVTEAELIRQALAHYLENGSLWPRNPQAWEEERAFIEELQSKGPVPGGRSWQREDLYDR